MPIKVVSAAGAGTRTWSHERTCWRRTHRSADLKATSVESEHVLKASACTDDILTIPICTAIDSQLAVCHEQPVSSLD